MSDQDPTPPDATPTPPGEPAATRPEQNEPNGPLAGLVATASAEAREEAAELRGDTDPEAQALLAQMGVEEEGIESGQVLGLWLVTVLSVLALATVLVLLFIIPRQAASDETASGMADNTEQEQLRTEAQARLLQYSRDGETYGLPLARAQAVIAAAYTDQGEIDLPDDRAGWNTAFGQYTPVEATTELSGGLDPTTYDYDADALESVGVDGPESDVVETVEPDVDDTLE